MQISPTWQDVICVDRDADLEVRNVLCERSKWLHVLEYTCQAWNPHQAYLIEKLECVQRNVTRWIIGKDIPYEDWLKSLKLATLVQRREFLSLVQLFKFIKGHSFVNTNDYISFSNRQSRKSHQFKLYKPFCRTGIFKYSFWHRYMDTWNSLSSSVVELASINAFKKALKSTLFN